MSINEIFENPTVKTVAFEIRFPNLFYIESKMGDFQVKIMGEFPESALLFRRQVVFADVGPEGKTSEIEASMDKETGNKVWQFKSGKGIELNISSRSLAINSNHHKTYNLGTGDKFREIIKFVLDAFFEKTSVPVINRIGLRYIDECPIFSKDNESFKSYYCSGLPIDRFSLVDVVEMDFKTLVKREGFYVRYMESLKEMGEGYKLILDFDGYSNNIAPGDCLGVTDKLHDLISDEYEGTIKEALKVYMRTPKEG